MKIGLIDVDGHNYPNIALMKISAYHKLRGDDVEWYWGFSDYDIVYKSKVFSNDYSTDTLDPVNTKRIIKGGTGYGLKNALPDEIEHMYPDYSLYPQYTQDTAFGFLTRGCPNNCQFCIVTPKEGRKSVKVADIHEWWNGQKNIVLCDPNILACPDHEKLLIQLAKSKAWVDINQGADARLLTPENIQLLNDVKIKAIHFAWDLMERTDDILRGLHLYLKHGKIKDHRRRGVYVLTNFNTTMEENLFRIETLKKIGFDPFVMVYDKPNAPREVLDLQGWCNNKRIFSITPDFRDYRRRKV